METRTRSGRISKQPIRYEPKEVVIDDFPAESEDDEEKESVYICLAFFWI